jgi:hypothetical protein
MIDRATTALDLFNERSFARDLAAFNSAREGASLLDHDEDFAHEAVSGFETETFHFFAAPGGTGARVCPDELLS